MKILIFFLFSFVVAASENSDAIWQKNLQAQHIPPADQSYCYTNDRGEIQGKNSDQRVRLASVSKLITSLWAIELLGAHYQFQTKLFIKGSHLHLQGSVDPFFDKQKLFFLLSQLNDLGFSSFDLITFDKRIQINPDAQIPSNEYPLITRESNAQNIKLFFNTASWSEFLKLNYAQMEKFEKPGRMRKSVFFETKEVRFLEQNPFEQDPDAKVLTYRSPELHRYLKEMNIQSNNYVAQTLFLKLGGSVLFEKYINEKFGINPQQLSLFTGSGLPLIKNLVRFDNFGTCRVIIMLIEELLESAQTQKLELKDLMAIPGSDGGTFSTRPYPASFKNSFVAKTGSLFNTSSIAGSMSSQSRLSYFGIFNQTEDTDGAHKIQDEMIRTLMNELGGPKPFEYSYRPFSTHTDENL
jgi:D-alanyl-D-alanine carboxypeptidase/D-alanyl-D-alanine-endopeptidase (penicillin-binding protein 4)